MKKILNSNKKKLKLRKFKEANKNRKRHDWKQLLAERERAQQLNKPLNKRKLLLVGLFFASILGAYQAFFSSSFRLNSETKKSTGICIGRYAEKVAVPKTLYVVKPAKKTIANPLLYKQISKIVKNTPMEKMAYDIARRNETVAAFIVGIAMKESKFGKYSPKKNGKECFNYWGYRGKENTTASGYSCFNSPSHAVKVVGNTIERIVKLGAKTPEQMISWKCGRSCAGHSPESVDKWIADVGINYYRIKDAMKLAKK